MKAFPIDFIRQIIYQGLEEEKIKDTHLIGGQNEVSLLSFYEQLVEDDEVQRYVEVYRDLVNQENRTGLIANGTIISPENPSFVNLNQQTIIPLSFTCNFRVTLKDRDLMLETINNLIERFKGRKVDIIEFESGKLFMVNTLGNNSVGAPRIENGSLIFPNPIPIINNPHLTNQINGIISALVNMYGFETFTPNANTYFYHQWLEGGTHGRGQIVSVIVYNTTTEKYEVLENDGSRPDILFPPEEKPVKRYCVSLSFDAIRCDEPRNLNTNEYCVVSFGGSATITSRYQFGYRGPILGNSLVKVGISKYKVMGETPYEFSTPTWYWLEPLEMPSGNNADSQIKQLASNNFVNNTHTDSITINNQYTFICDTSINLLRYFFEYGRYGIQGQYNSESGITPNTIYKIREIYSSFGNVEIYEYQAKVVESIDIENSESDVLTITIPFQVQGENQ